MSAPTLRALTARSVLLSTLLGCDPPQLPPSALVAVAGELGIAPTAARVALTRMVNAGDLLRVDGEYRLGERLIHRQRRQDDAVHPALRAWDGSWELVVVTAVGRGPTERGALRRQLGEARLAELREGVWLRPANLDRALPAPVRPHVQPMTAAPAEPPRELTARLWDLPAWARQAGELLRLHERARSTPRRFAVAAAVVRHLLDDPVLPPPLLPAAWPGPALRAAYASSRRELTRLLEPHITRRADPMPRNGQPA